MCRPYWRLFLIGAFLRNAFYYFNASTMAGIYRMVLKRLAEEYGVEFPIKGTIDEEPTVPWWFLN